MANPEILRERVSDLKGFIPVALLATALVLGVGIPVASAYHAGREEARKKTFGLQVEGEDVCGARGRIHLPELREQLNPITVIIHGETIEVDPTKGILSGQFSLDKGDPFLPADVDGERKPNDRIRVNYKDGVVNYEIECVKEPTQTPEKPATPTK